MSGKTVEALKFRETLERSFSAPAPSSRLPSLVHLGAQYRHNGMARSHLNRVVSVASPGLFTEQTFNSKNLNKVFASAWLDADHVIFGTKCNRLFVLNVRTGQKQEIVTNFWNDRATVQDAFESRTTSPTLTAASQAQRETPSEPIPVRVTAGADGEGLRRLKKSGKLFISTKRAPVFAFELEGASPQIPTSSRSLPDAQRSGVSFRRRMERHYGRDSENSLPFLEQLAQGSSCSESEDEKNSHTDTESCSDDDSDSDSASGGVPAARMSDLRDREAACQGYPPKTADVPLKYTTNRLEPAPLDERIRELWTFSGTDALQPGSVDAQGTGTPANLPPALANMQSMSCSGIHSIASNPSHTLVAVGSGKPVEVSIYSLPTMEPLAVLSGHKDLVFSLSWIDDQTLVTGSRDKSLRVWRLIGLKYHFKSGTHSFVLHGNQNSNRERVVDGVTFKRVWSPLLSKFLTVYAPIAVRKEQNYKVRSLSYNARDSQLLSLATDGFVKVWDLSAIGDKGAPVIERSVPLVHTAEAVCLEHDNYTNLYAVGSQSHVQFIDPRVGHSHCSGVVNVVDTVEEQKGWGVRSIAFGGGEILTIGGGLGGVSFYDMRSQKYLSWGASPESEGEAMLRLGKGYIYRDELYFTYFQHMNIKHAVYSLSYPKQHQMAFVDQGFGQGTTSNELFVGGGPLQLNLCGSYTGLWR